MDWNSMEKDLTLLKVIAVHGVLVTLPTTRAQGDAWKQVVESLKVVVGFEPIKTCQNTTKVLRDRFNLLVRRHAAKNSHENRATGRGEINEPTEYEILIEDLISIQKDSETKKDQEVTLKKENIEKEKEKVQEIRNIAMERMGETRKRKLETNNEHDDKIPGCLKKRRSSSDTLSFLKAKFERDVEERRVENEAKTNAQNNLVLIMAAQQQQNAEILAFQQQQAAAAQQQSTTLQQQMLELMKKLAEK